MGKINILTDFPTIIAQYELEHDILLTNYERSIFCHAFVLGKIRPQYKHYSELVIYPLTEHEERVFNDAFILGKQESERESKN